MKPTSEMQADAQTALDMRAMGWLGGTTAGWARAELLVAGKPLSDNDLLVMRNWFARHVHSSYPGYLRWVKAGRPMGPRPRIRDEARKWNGAVAWMLWGGNAAYEYFVYGSS